MNRQLKDNLIELLIIFLSGLTMLIVASIICLVVLNIIDAKQAVAEPITQVKIAEPYIEPEQLYIGEFTITGYCSCEKCCGKWAGSNTASGIKPTAGRTVGADWSVLPVGTDIYIEGLGYRTIEDKPADWIIQRYDGKIIDVYCKDHATALKIGRQTVKVYKSVR